MTAPTLSLQAAMRAALVADPAITGLVPAAQIYDRHARPPVFPCIVIGEMQETGDDMALARNYYRVFPTLHVWTKEPGLVDVKEIAFRVRKALIGNPTVTAGLADFQYNDSKFLRDPDGVTSHGVVTFEALYVETAL